MMSLATFFGLAISGERGKCSVIAVATIPGFTVMT